jgi:hypothetical protein
MQLHEIGPRRNPVVTSKREPLIFFYVNIEAGPTPHLRTPTISADDPPCGDKFVLHHHAIAMESGHNCSPEKLHAGSFCVSDQDAVKIGASNTKPRFVGESGFCGQSGTHKTNSSEAMCLYWSDGHTKSLQRRNAIRHKTLTTRLVDGRTATVSNSDFEPSLTRG